MPSPPPWRPVAAALFLVLLVAGCDDPHAQERARLVEAMEQVQSEAALERDRLKQEASTAHRETQLVHAKLDEAKEDVGAATVAWAATGLGLAMVILAVAATRLNPGWKEKAIPLDDHPAHRSVGVHAPPDPRPGPHPRPLQRRSSR